jgi:putative acetyltransferase
MMIRPETPHDFRAIETVHIEAFANHPYSKQTEHLIVNALRDDRALTVSLVAEIDGKVVGHIAFSPVKINGRDCPWFVLGPVGVLPHHQRRGIGQELIREGLKAIRNLGAEGCVLVGDPAYYSRFGFTHSPALVLEGVPPEYFMCLPMTEQIPRGCVSHHPAFSVTAK